MKTESFRILLSKHRVVSRAFQKTIVGQVFPFPVPFVWRRVGLILQVSFRKSEKLLDLRDRFCNTWNSKRKISNDSMKERTTRDRFLIIFFLTTEEFNSFFK